MNNEGDFFDARQTLDDLEKAYLREKQKQEVDTTPGETVIEDLTVENAPLVSVILQMRLYDVMLALLNNVDEETANQIAAAHDQGLILTSPPFFSGFAAGEATGFAETTDE